MITTNDTSAVAQQPGPPTPVIAHASPWQLSALYGPFTTVSHYTGEASASWNAEVQNGQAMSFGAEIMRMGPHIGLGIGVHHVEYRDQLLADERSTTDQTFTNHYSLLSVDTTVMVVVDTINQGGVIHYVCQQIDTSFYVLDIHTDTVSTAVVQRHALSQVNSESYWEIPLLFDIHTAIRRWSFGARFGPTIGLLSARSGSTPNSSSDGYTDLRDQSFRSMVYGMSARMYIRYRLGNALYLGVEPAMRGQLANALADDRLSRMSSAYGCYFSLTYRFP